MYLLHCKDRSLYLDAWIITIIWHHSISRFYVIWFQHKNYFVSTGNTNSIIQCPHEHPCQQHSTYQGHRKGRRRRKFATLFKCLIKAFCCSYGGNEFLMLSSPIRWLLWWFWLKIKKTKSKIYFLIYWNKISDKAILF